MRKQWKRWLWSLVLWGMLWGIQNANGAPKPEEGLLLVELVATRADEMSTAQRLKIKRLPSKHGYQRGAWILLYDSQQKPPKEVGWATVIETQGNELLAMVESLAFKAAELTLLAGPMPERVRVGKTLGVLLPQREASRGQVLLNLGDGDGVVVGDYYTVLGTPVSDSDASGRSLGRRSVGLLKIQSVETLTSVARVEQGNCDGGTYVKFVGRNPPNTRVGGVKTEAALLLATQKTEKPIYKKPWFGGVVGGVVVAGVVVTAVVIATQPKDPASDLGLRVVEF